MSIKLIPPRKEIGQTNFYGRGTYLGVAVNKSTGTPRKPIAARIIRKWEQDIERGVFDAAKGETFMSAAVRYMEKGGERRFVARLIAHFGPDQLLRPALPQGESLEVYWQREIDNAAAALYPTQSVATRNREVYTPGSAILKTGGLKFTLTRPVGSRGQQLTGWLWPEQIEPLLNECAEIDLEFGILCLGYYLTGLRMAEWMNHLTCDQLRLQESYAFVPRTKNGEPRPIYLPPPLVAALANHPRGLDRGTEPVFRFHKGGRLYTWLKLAAKRAGVVLPKRQAFHIFRHTYGTQMSRVGGLSTKGLVATGAWKSEQAAARYQHMVFSEEAQKANLLPVPKIKLLK